MTSGAPTAVPHRRRWLPVAAFALALAVVAGALGCSLPSPRGGASSSSASAAAPRLRDAAAGANARRRASRSASSAAAPLLSSLPPLRRRYLISSAIYYGRISNAKLSLAELLGLARALNRTAVVPKLDECGSDGADSSFDVLFDATALSREGALSLASFDVARECGGEGAAAFVSVGGGSQFDGPPAGSTVDFGGLRLPAFRARGLAPTTPEEAVRPGAVEGGGALAAAARAAAEPLEGPFFSGPATAGEALRDPLFARYFAPGTAAEALPRFMVEPLLPDKLARRGEACLVLSRTFLSLNWARLPQAFAEVGRELQPHAAVRADAEELLARHGLARRAFLAVHLRMGDFLTDAGHASFGVACNRAPALLTDRLRALLDSEPALAGAGGGAEGPSVVLATDDYNSACAAALRRAFPGALMLRDASRFSALSCRAALVDQEVLARGAVFVGDAKSTFSQAVHQIRTLRHARNVSSTFWM